jgi:diaminopimelate decarboxylase
MSHASDLLPAKLLVELADEFGSPLYVYHAEKIGKQYHHLKKAFSKSDVKIFYACKALTNINILKYIKQIGCGLDTVSIQEVHLGLKAGFTPDEIFFTPNCVDFAEIDAAKNLGVHINIDNISILEQFGNKYGNSCPVFIRINPNILAGGNYKISTGHIDSKFGISIHQVRHIERIVKTTNLKVTGLHMHTGSEIKDVEVFLEGFDVLLGITEHFPDLEIIDLGSGFKVPYAPDDAETDVDALAQKLKVKLDQFEKETGRHFTIWFEPGKYIVSQAGYFIVKANVIKHTTATVFVGVNSGFNHLIRPMFYDAFHLIKNISNPHGTERIYTVVGNLCETDTFGWDRKLAEVREGDYLVFYNAGAYGFEMSSNYNSRFRPVEVLYQNEKATLIRKRETMDDLLKNQIIE